MTIYQDKPRPLAQVMNEFRQAWVWNEIDQRWLVFTALDTVCMQNYCQDKLGWQAIGFTAPGPLS